MNEDDGDLAVAAALVVVLLVVVALSAVFGPVLADVILQR